MTFILVLYEYGGVVGSHFECVAGGDNKTWSMGDMMGNFSGKWIAILALAMIMSVALAGCFTSRTMLREIQSDIDRLNMRIDQDAQAKSQAFEQRKNILNNIRSTLDQEVQPGPGAPDQPTAPVMGAGDASAWMPPKTADDSAIAPAEARSIYAQGMAAYNRGDYDSAVERFVVVYRFAQDAALRSNALYWLGESYYRLKDWRRADSCFLQFEKEFSQQTLISAAMLKRGFALAELNRMDDARAELNGLVQRYPQSAEAPLARDWLQENPE